MNPAISRSLKQLPAFWFKDWEHYPVTCKPRLNSMLSRLDCLFRLPRLFRCWDCLLGFTLGLAMAINQVAVIGSPLLLGWLRDITGSYTSS
ncbi:hypothetical protein [Leptolyngbya sp. NIES-2104]|uniref:hypothetical protein n=1 Tax=Leptolyngbya sp. NIES-2104 TaxID=1552121 RepID=UPI00073EB621|nr:hypothetical protein [Leptolyngbya sp. NIES-2104]